ncbi:hypothetical protein DFH94DRAFT_72974 [Russula ochroleuca]|uniref:Uncharacterized protein n=1 Tax=Russula ochroleuca TaxID=152965 RepID=A0A9P5MSQ8_9AGAM|nr:hypothetical protein DFH94DRAFT_72974 [Russula ochroleuca]
MMTLARGERVSAVATLSPPASLSSCRTSGHWFRTIQHFFPLLCQSGATRQSLLQFEFVPTKPPPAPPTLTGFAIFPMRCFAIITAHPITLPEAPSSRQTPSPTMTSSGWSPSSQPWIPISLLHSGSYSTFPRLSMWRKFIKSPKGHVLAKTHNCRRNRRLLRPNCIKAIGKRLFLGWKSWSCQAFEKHGYDK